jgi:signal transduction histidine kinase
MDTVDTSPTASPASADIAVAAALCHEIYQPLTCLLATLEQAHAALRERPAASGDQAGLRLARWLADAHATANHLARVVADVHGRARQEPRRMRTLDLRCAVRAAAAMSQPASARESEIAVDAPCPAWVLGVDTRLVHVFLELFAEALREDAALFVRVVSEGDDVVTEVRYGAALEAMRDAVPRSRSASLPGCEATSPALDRAVVRHIVAAHGGTLEMWPAAPAGVLARVVLPLHRPAASPGAA